MTRSCETCGKQFDRKRFPCGKLEDLRRFEARKYCGHTCAGIAKIKSDAGSSALHRRAQKFKKKACEACSITTSLQVHHIDGDETNNAPINLMTLCRSCHTKWHWEHGKKAVCAPPCFCGTKSRRNGFCQKHDFRVKKYGDPFLTKRAIPGYRNPVLIRVDLLDRLVSIVS